MLVRLLVAVLMLMGPIPVRVCTCAAATGNPASPSDVSIPASPQRATGCGCGHVAVDEMTAETAAGQEQNRVVKTSDTPVRHDRDCPAVNPHSIVSAVLTPAADLAAAPGIGLYEPVELPVSERPGGTPQARPTFYPLAVPLYLSLLSLRI